MSHLVTYAIFSIPVVVALYLALRLKAVNARLPAIVRRIVDSDSARQIVASLATQVGLADEAKRQRAAFLLRDWVQQTCHVSIPDNLVNMAIEVIVHELKRDGVIPSDPSPTTPPPTSIPPPLTRSSPVGVYTATSNPGPPSTDPTEDDPTGDPEPRV